MIELLLCLQLVGGVVYNDTIESTIAEQYPCLEFELLQVAHAQHPKKLWVLFEREHLYMERKRLKDIKSMFIARGVFM